MIINFYMISIKVYLRKCKEWHFWYFNEKFSFSFYIDFPLSRTRSSPHRVVGHGHILKNLDWKTKQLIGLIFFTSLVAVPCIGSLKSFPFFHWLGQLGLLLTSLAACSAACKPADARDVSRMVVYRSTVFQQQKHRSRTTVACSSWASGFV